MEIRKADFSTVKPAVEEILNRQQSELGIEEQTNYVSFGLHQGERVVGGILAKTSLETAHIALLAVEKEFRGQDWGSKLLQQAEQELRRLGVKSITLTTRSYQAKGFYEKQGYTLFGELGDVPVTGVTKYFFVKRFESFEAQNQTKG
ncbi:GNAT family N-acetyltransferase [Enterococcus asini]|uniref:GNAT family N-acetyltransferase n=1 Tax=Enterococcus asini TaxID=57732 RepID=UPI00288EA748|nr:GNAT family N-acetyltransferase [Enterococcus asini]MDT2757842.1 GNAT family N-acetyltransferase [Enterococcus asini]